MLTLEGMVLAVIEHEARKGRDGKQYDAYAQVQLQVEEIMENGQARYGVQTMTTGCPDRFQKLIGKRVEVPVRAYVRSNTVAFTMQPNVEPVLARGADAHLQKAG